MLAIEQIEDGRFQITMTGAAFDALTERSRVDLSPEEAAEYGELTMPPAEVLRVIIREGLGLAIDDAADEQHPDLDDGVPF